MAIPLRHPLGGGRRALGPPGNRLTTQALRQGVPGASAGSVVQRAALFGAAATPVTATLAVTLAGVTLAASAAVYEVITATAAPTLDGVTLSASATVTAPAPPASTGPVLVPGIGLTHWSRWDG